MPKKKIGKHLKFYIDCMGNGRMIGWGLCRCSELGYINSDLLNLFKPIRDEFYPVYWASGYKNPRYNQFTLLRQTIVLFMAAINNEL